MLVSHNGFDDFDAFEWVIMAVEVLFVEECLEDVDIRGVWRGNVGLVSGLSVFAVCSL